eukprot:3316153-Rhodomonas_salina.1
MDALIDAVRKIDAMTSTWCVHRSHPCSDFKFDALRSHGPILTLTSICDTTETKVGSDTVSMLCPCSSASAAIARCSIIEDAREHRVHSGTKFNVECAHTHALTSVVCARTHQCSESDIKALRPHPGLTDRRSHRCFVACAPRSVLASTLASASIELRAQRQEREEREEREDGIESPRVNGRADVDCDNGDSETCSAAGTCVAAASGPCAEQCDEAADSC